MKVKIIVVNAFTDEGEGGNPAGIVLTADELDHNQKLSIANKVGLSETAFVSSSSVADFKLDFYTPTRQIAHCGHATIAVFSYLSQIGHIGEGWSSKETIDGNRKILIQKNSAYMEQSAPKYHDIKKYHDGILDSVGLQRQHIIHPAKLINTGNSFVVLGVRDKLKLSQLTPNFEMIQSISETLDLVGYYIFSLETNKANRDATARMFAPHYGINEESATGMAAGPLACYLYNEIKYKKNQYVLEQGYLMQPPSPSLINVNIETEGENIVSLMAGGLAKVTKEITIDIQ